MTSKSVWDPDQYEQFKAEREQPFYDLLEMVPRRAGMKILDLGCGTGELTAHMHRSLEAEATLGVDRSDTMLARSQDKAEPGLRFLQGDICDLSGEDQTYDLVFSNAALQWITDHEALWPQVGALVAPGGTLAIQIPANHDHISHVASRQIATEEPFATALEHWLRPTPVLPPETYSLMLHRMGFMEPRVELRIYLHLLPSRDAVMEWTRGTLLTAYQERLTPELFANYLARYQQHLSSLLPDLHPFPYPFKRILMCATRPA